MCVARSATIRAVTVPVWAMMIDWAVGYSSNSEWRVVDGCRNYADLPPSIFI